MELAELRRVVVGAALGELGVLLREEAGRAAAPPPKQPMDSKMRCGGAAGGQICIPMRPYAIQLIIMDKVQTYALTSSDSA